MNGFEGALGLSLSMIVYLLRFVLAALVLWLILGGLGETTLPALMRRHEAKRHPGGRIS